MNTIITNILCAVLATSSIAMISIAALTNPTSTHSGTLTPLITLVNDFFFLVGSTCAVACITGAVLVGVVYADYLTSAEATVNAINAQCGTQYQKLDYLRIGNTAMLQMCETRQKRIELR